MQTTDVHNFDSIAQKLMIFLLAKDIDERNILSLKNNIRKRKGQKLKMKIYMITIFYLLGNKDFISQESPIFADFKNIILCF